MNTRIETKGNRVHSASFVLPPQPITVREKNAHFIVLHWPGHKYYGGQGQAWLYAEAHFVVYEILDVDAESSEPDHFYYDLKHVIRFTVR